jgi:hypothetical protein
VGAQVKRVSVFFVILPVLLIFIRKKGIVGITRFREGIRKEEKHIEKIA